MGTPGTLGWTDPPTRPYLPIHLDRVARPRPRSPPPEIPLLRVPP